MNLSRGAIAKALVQTGTVNSGFLPALMTVGIGALTNAIARSPLSAVIITVERTQKSLLYPA